jgi:hypothetical protein
MGDARVAVRQGHLPLLSAIGAVNEIQRCDNAEIKRCLADRLAVEYRARRLFSLRRDHSHYDQDKKNSG